MVSGLGVLATALLALLVARPADGDKCFECASTALKNQWQLIGYPVKPKVFSDDCSKGQTFGASSTPISPNVDCSSFCVAVVMNALTDKGEEDTTTQWTVRGCYATLMGSGKQVSTSLAQPASGGMTKALEMGTLTVFNVDGDAKQVKAVTLSCLGVKSATDGPCNLDSASSYLADPCTTDCTKPAGATQCNQYPSKSSGSCTGAYCTKYDTWASGQYIGAKGCATVNPFVPPKSSGTGTKNYECIQYQDPVYVAPYGKSTTTSNVCYCNDKDNYCNGATSLSATSLALMGSSFFIALAMLLRK